MKRIQLSANFRTAGTIFAASGVLNGRSSGFLTARMPALANAASAASSKSGVTTYVFWRGERSIASITLSFGNDAISSSASPSCRSRIETSAVFGSPSWSTALSTMR